MDIFVINISDADNISPELLDDFRHKEFKNEKKRKEHSFSYLMLDRILKEFYKIENRDIEFLNEKPFMKTGEKYFSLSHSKEYVVIGISDNDCGLDIEKITNREFKSIAKRMKFPSKTLEEFYYDWTKYEAEYKLGDKCKSIMQTKVENYAITAASSNPQEKFEIYIQNGETFPNP